jgi:hypothetical protein
MPDHLYDYGFTHEEIAYGAYCIYEEEKRWGLYSGQDAHWFMAIERLKCLAAMPATFVPAGWQSMPPLLNTTAPMALKSIGELLGPTEFVEIVRITCEACARACELCAEVCEKQPDDERLAEYAKQCRTCASHCRETVKLLSK